MSSALKWKLIAGFLLVFIAGGATGVFVTMAIAYRFMAPHPPNMVAQQMKNRLRWQLRLSDEQMTRVSPIIDKAGAQLAQVRGDTGRRVRDIMAETRREITPILTPEQQQRLQQMEERRRRWFQNRQRGAAHMSPSAPEASPE